MKNWFDKNKELLVPTAVAIIVIIILGGIGSLLNSNSDTQKDTSAEAAPKKIEIPVEKKESPQNMNKQGEAPPKPETFYIEPRPGQLLEAIEGLDPVALDEQSQKLPGLKVMWPLYFFKIEEDENKNTFLYLDVSESGFGITVVCDADVNRYPQLNKANSGDLIWVAGEIVGLDATGTGQFHIKTEQIRFGGTKDEPPPVDESGNTAVVQKNAEVDPAPAAADDNVQSAAESGN